MRRQRKKEKQSKFDCLMKLQQLDENAQRSNACCIMFDFQRWKVFEVCMRIAIKIKYLSAIG